MIPKDDSFLDLHLMLHQHDLKTKTFKYRLLKFIKFIIIKYCIQKISIILFYKCLLYFINVL